MDWNGQPHTWKRRNKLLLGLATFWPPLYMVLFFVGIFSMMMILPFASGRDATPDCGNTDLLQLDQKIKDGRIKQLTLRRNEIVAVDRLGNCEYRVSASSESSREMILKDAREIVNGRPRVEKIDEDTSESEVPLAFPAGIMLLFGAHFLTIILMMGLMPLYIILAVKNEQLDQTMRIVWVVLSCTAGMFTYPVYWYLYIWRKQPTTLADGPAEPVPSVVS
jgi:hypothetical protein